MMNTINSTGLASFPGSLESLGMMLTLTFLKLFPTIALTSFCALRRNCMSYSVPWIQPNPMAMTLCSNA